MSGRLVGMVLDHCPAPPHQKLMLAAIAEHADETGNAWPSEPQLGNRCGVTDRTARRTITQLEKAGWVHVDRAIGRHNTYRINVHALQPRTPTSSVPRTPTSGVSHPNPGRPRPGTQDAHVRGPRTPTSSEPSRTVIEPARPGVSPPPNGRRPTLTPEATHHHAAAARAILNAKARPPPNTPTPNPQPQV